MKSPEHSDDRVARRARNDKQGRTPLPTPLRLVPDAPLPDYTYVPGRQHPHPTSDERGHSYGVDIKVEAFDPLRWDQCTAYLFGIDLFNFGYYWEAHEQWEAVWIEAGRRGNMADFLKGLIKLAAAGVKAREGREAGVCRHARRAEQLFNLVKGSHARLLGLDIDPLRQFAAALQVRPVQGGDSPEDAARVRPLWDFALRPSKA